MTTPSPSSDQSNEQPIRLEDLLDASPKPLVLSKTSSENTPEEHSSNITKNSPQTQTNTPTNNPLPQSESTSTPSPQPDQKTQESEEEINTILEKKIHDFEAPKTQKNFLGITKKTFTNIPSALKSAKTTLFKFAKKLTPSKSDDNTENAYTKIFGKTAKKQDPLIDNIISHSDQQPEHSTDSRSEKLSLSSPNSTTRKSIFGLEDKKKIERLVLAAKTQKQKLEAHFQIAKVFLGVSLLVPVTSLLLGSVFTGTEGFTASIVEHKNYALSQEDQQQQLQRITQEINQRQEQIQDFTQKIENIRNNDILSSIRADRIPWRNVFETVENVANRTFEGNKIARYVTFSNYSGDASSGNINVQGTVRNPAGNSWKSLILFKDALNKHPNFEGVTIKNFTKQRTDQSTSPSSEYTSPFRFQFRYIRNEDRIENEN